MAMIQNQHRKCRSTIKQPYGIAAIVCVFISLFYLPVLEAYPVCYGHVDLMYVVDASFSIEDQDFTVVCEFVVQSSTEILGDVGSDMRAAFLMYASTVYESQLIDFESYSEATFVPQLKTFTRDTSNIKTNTGAALDRAWDIYQAQKDPDAITFVVLVTDGQANDQEKAYTVAQQFKDAGVHILAIGIGNVETVDQNELETIASHPMNVVIQDKDSINDQFLYYVKKRICGETLFRKVAPEPLRDAIAMDVYFMLDESQTVFDHDFEIAKDFIKNIMHKFEISPEYARVGVLKFGTGSQGSATHFISLGSKTTEADLFDAVENLRINMFNSRDRSVISGFNRLEMDLVDKGDPNRPVVIVLLVSGLADGGETTVERAQALQASAPPNKYLLVLGVGTESAQWQSQRNQMAFNIDASFHTDNFLGISGNSDVSINFIEQIRQKIIELAAYQPAGDAAWKQKLDLVFLVDGSKQMTPSVHFAIVKFVMKHLIDQFQLGSDAGRAAVLIYDAAGWYNVLQFSDYTDRADLYNQIDNLQLIQRTDFADNAAGLAALRQYFQIHGREDAHHIGYVITTSASPNALLAEAEAKRLAADGVQLMVLGIGSQVSGDELNSLEVFEASGGPVYTTSLATVASTSTLETLSTDLQTYAGISRQQGLYFPWSGAFDLVAILHDGAGYVDNGIGAKNFLKDFFSRYIIGPNDVRAGVVTFGNDVNIAADRGITLGNNDYLASLLTDIYKLDLSPTGGANVNAAMAAAGYQFQTFGRAGVPKVALLVMEGNIVLDGTLTATVQGLKDAGINIGTVGVGPSTEMVDMQTIAHNPELAFMMSGWNNMEIMPLMDANLVALSRNAFAPSQAIGNILRLPDVCSSPAGIMYLIDCSDSMTDIFQDAKAFAAVLMSGFEMPSVQQGALCFGTQVIQSSLIPLGQYSTYVELYINFNLRVNQDPNSRGTGTFYALESATDYFNSQTGITEKVIVVMTDGRSDNLSETKKKAVAARAAGIQLVAIGVGDNILYQELLDITGSENLVFTFINEDLLDVNKLQLIQQKICELIRPGDCFAGSYRTPTTLDCLLCDQGSYQPLAEQLYCISCPVGQSTVGVGATSETQCEDMCPAGTFDSGAICELCPVGQYQPSVDQPSCVLCPTDRPITYFTGATSDTDCKAAACDVDMDLVLVVDCTASTGSNFAFIQALLANMMPKYEIGLEKTRISIVPIGDETLLEDVTLLSQSTDMNFLISTIISLQKGDQTTDTASALRMATYILDTESVGTRQNIPKIIWIITDGRSYSPSETKYEAVLARGKGYYIGTLGVGVNIFYPELQTMSSEPDKVIVETSYTLLPSLDITPAICTAADEWTPPIVIPDVDCNVAMDIAIVVDISSSNLFYMVVTAKLENLVASLPVQPDKVRIGIVTYGSTARVHLPLSSNPTEISNAIRSIVLDTQSGRAIALGLEQGRLMLLADQLSRVKALLSISSGPSFDTAATIAQAKLVHSAGIYAVAFAYGNVYADELNEIGDTGSNSVVVVPSVGFLDENQMVEKICPENFVCSYDLQVTYIWFLSDSPTIRDKITKFSKDLSDSFASVVASIIEVGTSDAADMVQAVRLGKQQLTQDSTTYTIQNMVIITDLDVIDINAGLPDDKVSTFATEVTETKESGVKVTLINAGTDPQWQLYASDPAFYFNEPDFDGKLASWHIQRSLCQEPCASGEEIQTAGQCDVCSQGEYRNSQTSYMCQACPNGTTTSITGATTSAECSLLSKCDVPMDLYLAIDATDSIGDHNFGLLKGFFWSLVEWFPVGLDADSTRIGVVKIGAEVRPTEVLWLNQSDSSRAVRQHIVELEGKEQATNTSSAIRYATRNFQESGRNRKKYPRIMIVATDGKSTKTFQTQLASAQAQLDGITMMAIALGSNVFMPEINAIASKDEYVFQFDNFDQLISSDTIQDQICEAARQFVPDDETDPNVNILGECKSNMDIVFVLDSSSSISPDLYFTVKLFIVRFAQLLDIGQNKIRIGIISFSDTVHTNYVFPLRQSNDLLALTMGVMSQVQFPNAITNTAAGLVETIHMFTTQGRSNSPYIAIVMTDGMSSNHGETVIQAQIAKNKGIHVVSIGYGVNVWKPELYDIATDPGSVRFVSDFSLLTTAELLEVACAYNFTCTEKMDVIALWDLENFDVITRAEKFISNLEESFPGSSVKNVFVDHVAHVGLAMEEARLELEGHPPSEASRVLVVITDKALDLTVKVFLTAQANQAKANNIIVSVVDALETNGISDIASSNKLAFTTRMFDVLPFSLVIQRALCIEPCAGGTRRISDGTCLECALDTYRDVTESFDCKTCPSSRITLDTGSDSVADCLIGKCLAPMDIVCVVDSSSSIGPAQYMLLKSFLANTVGQMDIGPSLTRVGLVPYSSDVLHSQVFDLASTGTQSQLINKIMALSQGSLTSGTNTARAIDIARRMILTQGRLSPSVMKTIIVITDGISSNTYRTGQESVKAQNAFIRVFAVGVGFNTFRDELLRIASDSTSLLEFSSFQNLILKQDFLDDLCEEAFVCPETMDVTLIEDSTPDTLLDTEFVSRRELFYQQFALSYSSPHTLVRSDYTSMADLTSKIDPMISGMSTNPEHTKVFLFITDSDIDSAAAQEKIRELKEAGAIVALLNANTAVDNGNFIDLVSREDLLFNTEEIQNAYVSRFIERKLCTGACIDGTERSEDGDCDLCPVGSYRTAVVSHQCLQCPPGETTLTTGATSSTACILDCGPGSRIQGSTCVECEEGWYQPDSFQSSCIQCDPGFTTADTGSDSNLNCIRDCGPGTYVSTDGQTCEPCPLNSYQPEALQAACLECPANLITDQTGAESLDECEDTCGEPMEVVFVVDGSASLTATEFFLLKGFVANSINRLKVSPTHTRIGIVEYADVAFTSPRISLEDTTDRSTATNEALALPQGSNPGVDLAAGIEVATAIINQQGRSGVPRNIVVVSARPSDSMSATIAAASEAKDSFIQILSVGVGLYNQEELSAISTDASMRVFADNFFTLASYDILPKICTAEYTCEESMDIYYVKNYGPSPALDAQVEDFLIQLTSMNTAMTLTQLTSGGPTLDGILTSNTPLPGATPEHTQSLLIFTNQPPSNIGATMAAADSLKQQGVIVGVVYNLDILTDPSFDNVATSDDTLFYREDFNTAPYAKFIARSMCLSPCGDGSERVDNVACTPCNIGSYRTASNHHVCESCGPGFTTATTGATSQAQCEATVCTPQEWQCDNGDCIPVEEFCDNTEQCTDGSDEVCNKCQPGFSWNTSSETCDLCPVGQFQPLEKQTECRPCPEGTTTAAEGADSENDCNIVCDKDGHQLNIQTGQCEVCPIGYYRNKNLNIACVPCRDKFTTEQPASGSQAQCVPDCIAGEYWSVLADDCEPCPVNSYQPDGHQFTCEECPDGTTTGSITGADSVLDCQSICDPGHYLPEGGTSQAECTQCPIGTYSTSADVTCKPCQPEYTTAYTGSTDPGDCIPDCVEGEYFDVDVGQCLKCEAGTFQPLPHQFTCVLCPSGTTTEEQGSVIQLQCIVPCAGGEYLEIDGSCVKCAVGTYRPDDDTVTECQPCANGYTTNEEGSDQATDCLLNCVAGTRISGSTCEPCDQGRFQILPRQTTCDNCPSYTSTLATGADSPNLCIDPCASGSELVSVSPIQCQVCAKDTYKAIDVDESCKPCSPRHVTLATGATSSEQCLPDCSAGERWDTVSSQCVDCEVSTFQNRPHKDFCFLCPTGWITLTTGSTTLDQCLPNCAPGFFWNSDAGECQQCERDEYQPEAYQFVCLDCPDGTATDGAPADDITHCTDPCGAGQVLPEGGVDASDCVDCPVGYYNDGTTSTCLPCQDGFTTDGTGQTTCLPDCGPGTFWSSILAVCTDCQLNTYQEQFFQTVCEPCLPAGYITLTTGADNPLQCAPPCQPGYEWSSGTCVPCSPGFYQNEANQASCKPCSPPLTSTIYGATQCLPTDCSLGEYQCADDTCVPGGVACDGTTHCSDQSDEAVSLCCVIGQYRDPVTDTCTDCPIGTYQDMIGKSTCIQCPNSKVTTAVKADSLSDCVECALGFEFIAGATACSRCPLNTYRSAGMPRCAACPQDHITLFPGATTISACLPDCRAGEYFDGTSCTLCLPGTFQYSMYQSSCDACPIGKTTVDPPTGATTSAACQDICPDGETLVYDSQGRATTDCELCPEGEYKVTVQSSTCQPCPVGFTTDGQGGAVCYPDCSPGYYWTNIAVSVCTACPKGQHQVLPLQGSCDQCPEGQTTPGIATASSTLCYSPCSSGYEYNAVAGSCDPCPVGMFSTKDIHEKCQACLSGFTTVSDTSTSEDQCVPDCPAGQFYNEATKRCEDCNVGYHQPLAYQTECIQCPPGTTSLNKGAVTCEDVCPLGYETQSDGSCLPCPEGQVKVTVCTPCPEKFTTDVSLQPQDRVCVPDCPAGQYWDSTKCSACPRGYYQPNPYMDSCIACDTGLTTIDTGSISVSLCTDICPSGFELQYTGKCVECKRNYYRIQGDTNQCIPCPGNYITLFDGAASLLECLPICLAGSFWNFISGQCELCPVGSYQPLDNQDECTQCPVGMITVDLSGPVATPVAGATSQYQCVGDCAAGSYWDDLIGQCRLCLKGFHQTFPYRDECSECSPGFTTHNTGSTSETDCFDPCASGYTHDRVTNQCVPCGYHRFRDRSKDNVCQDCDPEALITLTDHAESADECVSRCGAGEEWVAALMACVPCSLGFYQPDQYSMECLPCPSLWTTLTTGAIAITDCKPPCGLGEEWSVADDSCVYCPLGKYQNEENEEYCKNCSPGFTTAQQGATRSLDCIPFSCDASLYDWECAGGSVPCGVRCDSTQDCQNNDDELGCDCQQGWFYEAVASSCQLCPAGSYQDEPGQFMCKPCPEGFTSPSGSDALNDCTDRCSAGEQYDLVSDSCSVCPVGTFRPAGALGGCKDCPKFFTTETQGSTQQADCIPECLKGTYYDSVDQVCKYCGLGQYQDLDHKTYCESCGFGLTTTSIGAQDSNQCEDVCPAGEELPLGRVLPAGCTPCVQGEYKDPSVAPFCLDCGDSRTTRNPGSTTIDDCIPECELGEEFNADSTGCVKCPRGTYNDAPLDGVCKPCPPGKTTQFIGTQSIGLCLDLCNDGLELYLDRQNCVPCQEGWYRSRGVETECQQCPTDQTTPDIGAATIDECKWDCPSGSYYSTVSNKCELCPLGTYQPLPLETECFDCNSWRTTATTGSTSPHDCIDKCVSGWEDSAGQCVECPRGQYRTVDVHPACVSCRIGWTTLAIATTSADQCVPDCPKGQHWDDVSDRCVVCEEGTYNPDPYQLQCRQCPPDKPLQDHTDDGFTMCKADCPPGEMWNRDRQICNWCLRGTYRSDDDTRCLPCPDGTTTPDNGAVSENECSPVQCPLGTDLNPTTGVCEPCPEKYYRNDASKPECRPCPGDSSADRQSCLSDCQLGEYVSTSHTCVPCSRGSYQDEINEPSCKRCPNNWSTVAEGSTSINQCQNGVCPAGSYYSMSGDECVKCGIGSYRGGSQSQASCTSCPKSIPATYSETATSVAQCKADCGPGSYIDTSTETCELCDKSSYQDKVNWLYCKSCPKDQHTMNKGSTDISMCRADWCDAGYRFNPVTTGCDPCGIGFYRTVLNATCIACPLGQVTYTDHAESAADCQVTCGPGAYIDLARAACVLCDRAHWQDLTNRLQCKPCTPEGFHTMNEGATALSMCQADWCDPGWVYIHATDICVPCGYGYYRSKLNVECIGCPGGYTTASKTATSSAECIPVGEACASPFNLVIAVDLSNSADTTEVQNLQTYLKALTARMRIGSNGVHVGILKYATSTREVLNLRAGCRYGRVANAINNGFLGSRTSTVNTVAALRQACEMFWRSGASRSGLPMRILLITDDTSSDAAAAITKASTVKAKGVHITAIGPNSAEVSSLASTTGDAYVITDYNNMPPLNNVLTSVCP